MPLGTLLRSTNYRLGADGFLFLGDGISNLGLLDQIAALEWVQENIAAFGGDTNNVTIFGESAGGMSVSTLLSMPRAKGLFRRVIAQGVLCSCALIDERERAKGLFHRVIAQSGAGHHVISPATGKRVGQYLAEKLGVEATRAAIAAESTDRLLQAQMELSADAFGNPDPERWGEVAANLMPFEPVIDEDILPTRPIDSIVGGAGTEVDVMIGTNADEEMLFLVPNGAINHINEDILVGAVAAYGLPVSETIATYRSIRPDASAGELYSSIVTDWFFRIPAIRLAEAHTKGSGGNLATTCLTDTCPIP